MNDGDYQNIIQYSEVMSKDASQMSRPRDQVKFNSRNFDAKRRSFQIDATSQGVPPEEQLNQIQTDITRKEQEENGVESFAISRIPGTAREPIMDPLHKLSGNRNPSIQINQTISSYQSINSDDKIEVEQKKAKLGVINMHGHSQSQQINIPDSKSSPGMHLLLM